MGARASRNRAGATVGGDGEKKQAAFFFRDLSFDLNAYRDLSFDLSCQRFHQMPLRRSTVSSRDLASSGLLCMPTKEVRWSGYADTHGSGSALRRHALRECSGSYCGTVGSARNRPRCRYPRWIRTSAAAQKK